MPFGTILGLERKVPTEPVFIRAALEPPMEIPQKTRTCSIRPMRGTPLQRNERTLDVRGEEATLQGVFALPVGYPVMVWRIAITRSLTKLTRALSLKSTFKRELKKILKRMILRLSSRS